MSVVQDGEWVYWTNNGDGTVRRAPLGGGSTETLSSAGTNSQPFGLAVDDQAVYWTDKYLGTVSRFVRLDRATTVLAAQQGHPTWIVESDNALFWLDYGAESSEGYVTESGSLMSMPVGGAPPRRLVAKLNQPWGLAVDGNYVYWTILQSPIDQNDGSVWRMPRNGGSPELIAAGQFAPRGMAVRDNQVCWANWGYSPSLSTGMRTAGAIVCETLGDQPITVAADQLEPFSVALLGEVVYWTGGIVPGSGVVSRFRGQAEIVADAGSYVTTMTQAGDALIFLETGAKGIGGRVRRISLSP